jgi:hypothetical protein
MSTPLRDIYRALTDWLKEDWPDWRGRNRTRRARVRNRRHLEQRLSDYVFVEDEAIAILGCPCVPSPPSHELVLGFDNGDAVSYFVLPAIAHRLRAHIMSLWAIPTDICPVDPSVIITELEGDVTTINGYRVRSVEISAEADVLDRIRKKQARYMADSALRTGANLSPKEVEDLLE